MTISVLIRPVKKGKKWNDVMQKAFSLVELLIVIAILGIAAALVIPELTGHTQQTKEAVAKENIRTLRQQIDLYVVKDIIDDIGLYDAPVNPFNNLKTINGIAIGPLPSEPTGDFGWIYHAPTHTVKLDWPGTDSEGIAYYDY